MRLRSLRAQLAIAGFAAIYVPVLVMFGVSLLTSDRTIESRGVVEVTAETGASVSPWAVATVVALAPAAAGLAWWWSGRAVRPIERVQAVAEDIEMSDLSRRIALDRGPAEVVALAASFDAMLGRLESAATTQRRLIEETSHELRTPLAVLSTNADVLLEHPEPTLALYRQGLQRSRSAALRLRATIDELLVDARGRARTLDRRPADAVGIVRAAVDDAGVLAARRGVALRLDGASALTCRLDEPTVRRAVGNLVDNAVKHAPAGTTVEVEVLSVDERVVIAVTDHGAGIDPPEQARVFERFWHGGDEGAGSGLGLAIARQIAQAHGGGLTLASPGPAGDGCRFELTLRG